MNESKDLSEINVETPNSENESYEEIESVWSCIPENVLLKVFEYSDYSEIVNCSGCCKRWNTIANDELLWKQKFQHDFKIDKSIPRKPGSSSWQTEYRRLTDNVPMVLTDILTEHSHQVLHVSFSHNGKLFATCSKDGFIIVWNSGHPSTVKYKNDMKGICWKYTQYSQFNASDTLLLVSGVHFGTPFSTSGEIAVFSVINGFNLRCRVLNRPYDIFGTWFSDQHLLSGDLHWLAHLVSTSVIWLNKANQETSSENVPVMQQLYKFYNRNASSVRALMVANCPWLKDRDQDEEAAGQSTSDAVDKSSEGSSTSTEQKGNPISVPGNSTNDFPNHPLGNEFGQDYARPIQYSEQFRRDFEDNSSHCESSDLDEYEDDEDEMDVEDDEEEDLDACPKYLIFSTGSKTYTPHQIGFKRIGKVNFPKRLDPGPSLKERIAMRDRQKELEIIINSLTPDEMRLQNHLQDPNIPREEPNWLNEDTVADRFDGIDKLIDLDGHIIGMALSPDNKFLYVNSRPWPKNCVITNPLKPPPISQEIDIHVIDLQTLKKVGTMLRSHKAYTPNTDCFFIFLDVCDSYVGSGAEDRHAYLWERFYGVCLGQYKHEDVVNSVAFNPKDNEMFVSTSDDYEIKIWRSQASVRKNKIPTVLGRGIEIRNKSKKQ
ncbi:unnamed protein product [Diamesa serratosioi]